MRPEYIVDTSAVRSLSARVVARCAASSTLTISPLSVFELLCHLDEPSPRQGTPSESFAYWKQNVMKCEYLTVRDDPFAEQAAAVGARAAVNPTRFEDKVVLPQIFPKLRQASSLEEFFDQTVRYPTGEEGSLRDVAANARRTLDEAEQGYIAFVNDIEQELLTRYGFDGALALQGGAYVRYVIATANNLARHYQDEKLSITGGAVFSAIFLYVGYVLARTRLYMRQAGKDQPLQVDPNDMEDSAILLHLDLTEPRVLVTNDGSGRRPGTIGAFKEALQNLTAASQEVGAEVVALPRVIRPDQLESTVLDSGQ
jgi:hypothetical protein